MVILGPSVVFINTERTTKRCARICFVLFGDVLIFRALDVADDGFPVDGLIQVCRHAVAGSFGQHGLGFLNFFGIKSEKKYQRCCSILVGMGLDIVVHCRNQHFIV